MRPQFTPDCGLKSFLYFSMDKICMNVYPKRSFIPFILIVSALFIWGGWLMTQHPYGSRRLTPELAIIIGYITIIFGSLCILSGLGYLVLSLLHIPLARIFDDHLEYLIPLKMKYKVIPYIDIQYFAVPAKGKSSLWSKYTSNRQLYVIDINNQAVPTTLIDNNINSIDNVCDTMNEKLNTYWQQPILNQKLDIESVGKYMEESDIDKTLFGFDETPRPDRTVLIKKSSGFQIIHFDRYATQTGKKNYNDENDACRIFLQNVIRQHVLNRYEQ